MEGHMKMIRVTDLTHQKLQMLAVIRAVPMHMVVLQGINATLNANEINAMRAMLAAQDDPRTPAERAAVADALACYMAADPRTPEQIAQDAHTAEVLDTQASDRPC
jgi:hypothetical protein